MAASNQKYHKQLKTCATQLIKASEHLYRHQVEPSKEDAESFLQEIEVLSGITEAIKTDLKKEIGILTTKK